MCCLPHRGHAAGRRSRASARSSSGWLPECPIVTVMSVRLERQERRHGAAHDVAASEHHRVPAVQRDLVVLEQPQHAERRGGHEARQARAPAARRSRDGSRPRPCAAGWPRAPASPSAGAASGSCTRMPCTPGSAPSCRTRFTTSSVPVPAGTARAPRRCRPRRRPRASSSGRPATPDRHPRRPARASASCPSIRAHARAELRLDAHARPPAPRPSAAGRRRRSATRSLVTYGICSRWMRVAFPSPPPRSRRTAFNLRSPPAGCSRSGISVRNRRNAAAAVHADHAVEPAASCRHRET